MILDLQQIKNIIINNPNRDLIVKAQEYNKKMKLHFYGDKTAMKEHLTTIDGFEKPTLHDLRVKYAQSNKDLMARLSRPIDKVFSARGGSIYYTLPDEQEKKARLYSSDVRSGYSIKKWIEQFWKTHYLDDPGGLIFMEISSLIDAVRLKQQGKSIVYPTYKSITTIYDYQPNGAQLEYVVFETTQQEKTAQGFKPEDKIYRVVDDSKDYWVQRKDEDITVLEQHTYNNYFLQVPAMLNSDIPDPNVDGLFISFFDPIIELCETFLLKGSIRVTHDFLHGFPKYWQYATSCKKCSGEGVFEGEKCKECNGTGKDIVSKVSDAMLLEFPDKDSPAVTPDIAGYVSPDKTYHEIVTTDLQVLEDLMKYTSWGAAPGQKTQGIQAEQQGAGLKTATQVVDEVRPQADRLSIITEAAEKRHKFILDAVIRVNITQSYSGASVSYGKRYMLEGPDEIWDKYSEARKNGAAISVLDDLLLEYYEAKYVSDEVKLTIQKKLMKVEPFVHFTIDQVQKFMPSEEDYKAKLYFGEWLATVNDGMLLSMSEDGLRSNLMTSVSSKQLQKPEQQKPVAA